MRILLLLGVALTCLRAAHAQDWDPPNLLINPGFEDTDDEGQPLAWSGVPEVYSVVEQTAHSGDRALQYENADPERYVHCTQGVQLEPGRAYELSGWVKAEGIEGADTGATLCVEWQDADGGYLGGHYPAGVTGTTDWQRITSLTPRVPENAASFHVLCYVRRGMTGSAWFDDVELKLHREPPLHTVLTRPNYRGRLMPGQRTVEVAVALTLTDWGLGLDDVQLVTTLETTDGEALRPSLTHAPESSSTTLLVDASELPIGPALVRIRLEARADGRELATQTWRLQLLGDETPVEGAAVIDEHNRVLIDGEPFFPLGMYWGGIEDETLRTYADSAFDCLMPYGAPDQQRLDLAHELGLKVIYSVKDIYYGSTYCPPGIETVEDERAYIEERATAYRDHPALLAWYLNDELPAEYMDRLELHQQWLEELDPNHPTWVVLYQVDQVGQYVRTFDAIGTDPYPIPRSPAAAAGDWTRKTVAAVAGARPVWMVPQVFNWACYHDTEAERAGLRAPTLEEMRSMAWQCIAEGATGLIFYSYFDLSRDPLASFDERWPEVKLVAQEIADLTPVLLSVEEPPDVAVQADDGVLWTLRQLGEATYVMLVNAAPGARAADIALPQVADAEVVLGAGAGAQGVDALHAELDAFEVRVYAVTR